MWRGIAPIIDMFIFATIIKTTLYGKSYIFFIFFAIALIYGHLIHVLVDTRRIPAQSSTTLLQYAFDRTRANKKAAAAGLSCNDRLAVNPPQRSELIGIYEIHRWLQSQQHLQQLSGGAWHLALAPFPTSYRLDLTPHRLGELSLRLAEMGA